MENIRSDDFAGLLAALGRTGSQPTQLPAPVPMSTSVNPPSVFSPAAPAQNQVFWQPLPSGSFPNLYPQPQYSAVVPQIQTPEKKSINYLVVGLIVLVALALGIIIWMRLMSMKSNDDGEEEEEENKNEEFYSLAKKETREIPPPSTVEEIDQHVSENVMNFVREYESFDVSGQNLPLEFMEAPEKINLGPKKRIVADESQEVLDYAKRRDALFDK